MRLGRVEISRVGVRLMPSRAALRERDLTMERDTARLMLIGLAAAVTEGKRRPAKDVERLLSRYRPVVDTWTEGASNG